MEVAPPEGGEPSIERTGTIQTPTGDEGHTHAEDLSSLQVELQQVRSQLSEALRDAQRRSAETAALDERLQQALGQQQQQQQQQQGERGDHGRNSIEGPRSTSTTSRAREPSMDEERLSLRLHKAEHALEQERLACSQLRRQLEAARQLQHQAPAPGPSGQGTPGSAAGGSGVESSGGSAALRMGMMSEMEEVRREAAVAQTQLLQRTVEVERLRRVAGEREEEAGRLRRELEGMKTAGSHTAQLQNQIRALQQQESALQVQVRAAEDRCRAAEQVSLDMRQQCEAAAVTIGRLIDESSELVTKINAQANVVLELRTELRKRDTGITALEQLLVTGGRLRLGEGRGEGAEAGGDEAAVGKVELHAALMAAVEAAVRAQGGGGLRGMPGAGAGVVGGRGVVDVAGGGPSSAAGGGGRGVEVASEGGGGPDDEELKLEALQEEVAGLEAELRREREVRLALAAEHSADAAVGVSAPGVTAEVAEGHPEWVPLLASAAASGGLPPRLRVQALAQTLAVLDEELERERRLVAQLRQAQGPEASGAEAAAPAPGTEDPQPPPAAAAAAGAGPAPLMHWDAKDGPSAPHAPPTQPLVGEPAAHAVAAPPVWRPGRHLHGEAAKPIAAPPLPPPVPMFVPLIPEAASSLAGDGGEPAADDDAALLLPHQQEQQHQQQPPLPVSTSPQQQQQHQQQSVLPVFGDAVWDQLRDSFSPEVVEVEPLHDLVLTPQPRARRGVWGWNWLAGGDLVAY